MAKQYPWKTTGELRKWIESHPESGPARAERRHEELKIKLRQDREPILSDLRRLGFHVESLYNLKEPYVEALPVLLRHLRKFDAYDPRTRIGIAHTLITKDMKNDLPLLIEAFRNDPDHSINGPQWVLGQAIEELYDDRYAEDVVELALDRSHEGARTRLVHALAKSRKPIAREALEQLKSDPDMAKWVDKIESRRAKKHDKSRKKRQESLAKLKRGLTETSMNFDIEDIPGLLKAIAARIRKGFGSSQIRKVMTEVRNMEPEERSLLEFQVKPGWRTVPLQILIHKCDEDAADVYFYSSTALVTLIDEELERVQE